MAIRHTFGQIQTTTQLANAVKSLRETGVKTPDLMELGLLLLLATVEHIRTAEDVLQLVPENNVAGIMMRKVLEGRPPLYHTQTFSLDRLNRRSSEPLPSDIVSAIETLVRAADTLSRTIRDG